MEPQTSPTPSLVTAFKAYHDQPPGVPWQTAVQAHWERGVVINSPQLFALARLVRHDWPASRLLDVNSVALHNDADSWMIWIAAGDLRLLIPWTRLQPMDYVIWQHRTYDIKIIPWEKALLSLNRRNRLKP